MFLISKLIESPGAQRVTRIFLVFLTIIFFFINPLYSKRLAVLPEVDKPQNMIVDNGQLFISDQTVKVHVYSMKDFKYQVRISRQGQGPGECEYIPSFRVGPDYIFLYSLGKGILFSRDGNLKRELRIPRKGTESVAPLGEDFVCQTWGKSKRDDHNYYDISIYSYNDEQGLEYKKILYYFDLPPNKRRGGKWDYHIFRENNDYVIYDNKVFVGDSTRGIFVEVFDNQGNKINQIKLDVNEIKLTAEYKKHLMNILKQNPEWDMATSIYNIVLPDYFPAFYRFSVDNGKVYFLTHKLKSDNQREVIITNLKGNLLKRTYVPWIKDEFHIQYAIENDKFYYILANETTEDWELHVEEIK
jgi:hypothetical protein